MFILQTTNIHSEKPLYFVSFGKYKEVTLDKEHALTVNNIFEAKQLVNKHNIKDYKIIEVKE